MSGSILYVIWWVVARFLKKEDFLYALTCGIHLVVVFYTFIVFVCQWAFLFIDLQPGKTWWSAYTVSVKNMLRGLLFAWIFGAMCKSALYIIRRCRLRKLTKTYIPCDPDTRKIFESICREMRIKRRISIVQSMSVPAAKIEGVLHPRVCIPMMDYQENELQVILKHELVHYLNHDGWMRECAVLLECIYWFNPLVSMMHRSLECWDEYYCDYRVCHQYGVNKENYVGALVAVADRIVEWKEKICKSTVMDVAFVVSGKNLKERIRRIKNYKEQGKQKKVFSIALCGLFVLVGCTITFFAGTGAEVVYAKMIETTYQDSSTLEMLSEPMVLKENVMVSDEIPVADDSVEGEATACADSTAAFSSTVKNELWKSDQFQASSDQDILVVVCGAAADVCLKVGIVEPDGQWRYVYSCGNIVHTFTLNKTGKYNVFVWNETDTEVTIIGHYITTDSE